MSSGASRSLSQRTEPSAGAWPSQPPDHGVFHLSAEEQARVEAVARARHLPASTLVRSWILDRLDAEKSA